MTSTTDHPVILFDGDCSMCSAVVRFVLRRDPSPGQFRFASLQSDAGQRLLEAHRLPTGEFDSFVLIDHGTVSLRSSAALGVVRRLGFPWSLLAIGVIVPRPLRDALYRWVARNRYRWFGRLESCMVPAPEDAERFLDSGTADR